MADLEDTPAVSAGWYADYTGEQRMRWWDGSQWTDHVSEPGPPAYSVAPLRNTVPASTPTGNVYIWILVLLPIIPLVLTFTIDYRALFELAISQPRNPLALYSTPGYLALLVSGWIIFAASVVLAYFDFRRLRSTGFDRPFHWAWAFLSYVYIIGRSVVVRRQSGRGLAPLFVWVAIYFVSIIVSLLLATTAMSGLVDLVSGGYTNT